MLNTLTYLSPEKHQSKRDHLSTNPIHPTDTLSGSLSYRRWNAAMLQCCNKYFWFKVTNLLFLLSCNSKCLLFQHCFEFHLSITGFSHSDCSPSCFLTCACRLSLHVFVSMFVRIRISCGSDMGFGCDRRACKHASL